MWRLSLVLFAFLFAGVPTLGLKLNSTLFTGCGVNKTCLSAIPGSCSQSCTPDTCKVLYTIENVPSEDSLLIGLHSVANYGYMAIGFSINNKMPDTDVVGCQKSDANTAQTKDTYNVGYVNLYDNDNSAISDASVWIDGDAFSCWFTRKYIPPINIRGHTLNASNYYVFTAVGVPEFYRGQTDHFKKHLSTPCMSGPLDLTAVTSRGADYSLVGAHGMLLLLACYLFTLAISDMS